MANLWASSSAPTHPCRWHGYTVLYPSPQWDSMRIHDNSFTVLTSQEEAGKLHADIWHPPKLTHALQDPYPTAPSGGPREDIQCRSPAMGRGSHDPGPHLSARMCDVSLLFSPQPINPHQFRYTSCTCNKNTPIHNYSADHLLIHVQPTWAPHLGPYGRHFLSALLPVAYFSFTPWSPL